MKRLLVLFVCLFSILNLAGCQEEKKQEEGNQQESKYIMTPGELEVVIIGDGKFPEELAGNWKGNKEGWAFTFEKDGRVSKAIIAMGKRKIIPGEITTVPAILGGTATFVPGDWLVTYDPDNRELAVKVVMNYINIELGEQTFRGKSEDIIIGTVSEDGSVWNVTINSFPEYEMFPNNPEELPYTQEATFLKTEKDF